MPFRTISIDGSAWRVQPSGMITQYNKDEFALIFTRGEAASRESRAVRYSPRGALSREESFAELSDEALLQLFVQSQPSATSPELNYSR